MAADRRCATSARNSAAVVFFFRRCNSRKASAEDLSVKDGVRILWTIFSSRSLRAPPLVRPTHRFSRAGQNSRDDSGVYFPEHCDSADLESGGSFVITA